MLSIECLNLGRGIANEIGQIARGNFWDVESGTQPDELEYTANFVRRGSMISLAQIVPTLDSRSALTGAGDVQSHAGESQKCTVTLLAPTLRETPTVWGRTVLDGEKHTNVLRDIQAMRGEVYREYDPIAAALLNDGRHCDPLDEQSWHIVLHSPMGYILGSSRYRVIGNGFEELAVSRSALASSEYGPLLKAAVQRHIQQAISSGVQYGEAGMWALRPEARCSTAAVTIALLSFALAKALGGGLGITTATTRHGSSSILQRLGGATFPGLPSYYEPKYGCTIEVLHFDSAKLGLRYRDRMRKAEEELTSCKIICAPACRDNAADFSSPRTTLDLLELRNHVASTTRSDYSSHLSLEASSCQGG